MQNIKCKYKDAKMRKPKKLRVKKFEPNDGYILANVGYILVNGGYNWQGSNPLNKLASLEATR